MADQTLLQRLFQVKGGRDFRWIDPAEIVVGQWVRMKCMYGCSDYGRNASCPPNTPSVAECRDFFLEYRLGVIFRFSKRFDDPEERHAWSRGVNMKLVELEREVFLAGYQKAFLLFMDNCQLCRECARTRTACHNRNLARPTPEGMGVDVFATVAKFGYPIEVLAGYEEEMNRYAFLLIE
ncbi:DUF2284 domain-containing protein [Geobacter argillaceus]|uniref:Putative metal-binding protein n=1 Tax=Geobacter argillaceus TaxID=345631 RepID=A0A562VNU5_9BACT|nr:DUF2284 domain-containing protein [Geobacter argillaceus]TWJ19565.1 putative metal-binding protein [Geobacter argillaceus]